jgi:hypothetical protein
VLLLATDWPAPDHRERICLFCDSVSQEAHPQQNERRSFLLSMVGHPLVQGKLMRMSLALRNTADEVSSLAHQPTEKFSGWGFKRKELEARWQSMGDSDRLTRRRSRLKCSPS